MHPLRLVGVGLGPRWGSETLRISLVVLMLSTSLTFGLLMPSEENTSSSISYTSTESSKGQGHSQSVRIGVLVDLHEPPGTSPSNNDNSTSASSSCGPLNTHSYQKLKAVEWAVETINNKSWPGEFALEIEVYDTCGESGIASLVTSQLLNETTTSGSELSSPSPPTIGLIVIGSRNNERIIIDRPLQSLINISAIVTSPSAASLDLYNHPNVFTTAPDLSSVTEGVVAVINQLGASQVAVLSTNSAAVTRFQKIAGPLGINASKTWGLKDPPSLQGLVTFLQSEEGESIQSVAILLESEAELETLVVSEDAQTIQKFRKLARQKSWIIGGVGVDDELVKDFGSKFNLNVLLIQPRASVNSDFTSYFVDKLAKALIATGNNEEEEDAEEAIEYVESVYHCSHKKSRNSNLLSPCNLLGRGNLLKKLHHESDIGFIINAVSSYSAALRLAQLSCTTEEGGSSSCSPDQLSSQVFAALQKSLKLPHQQEEEDKYGEDKMMTSSESTISTSHEIEGTQRRVNFQGQLVSRKYDLFLCRSNGKLTKIGQYSHEDGLVLDVMLAKLEGGTSMQDEESGERRNTPTSGTAKRRGKNSKSQDDQDDDDEDDDRYDEGVHRVVILSTPELYISRIWAMVATAISITGVFISLYILIYVLQRMCDGTLRGNQVLGILLLLGIIMMYSSVVLFVLPPGPLLCNMKVFIPSLSTALCLGILLLKGMQLRSLVSLGLGGKVPPLNQFITLLFIVGVQLGVDIQWFININRNKGSTTTTTMLDCPYSPTSFYYLHSYLPLLTLIVLVYGLSVLKIRRNYNEAKWITLASSLCLPIPVGWGFVVWFGPTNFQEPAACGYFIITASVLLFSVFIPKLNTISRQSKKAEKKMMSGSNKGTLEKGNPTPQYHPSFYGGSISTIFTTLDSSMNLKKKPTNTNTNKPQGNYALYPANANHHQGHHTMFVPPPLIPPNTGTNKSTNYYSNTTMMMNGKTHNSNKKPSRLVSSHNRNPPNTSTYSPTTSFTSSRTGGTTMKTPLFNTATPTPPTRGINNNSNSHKGKGF